MEKLTYKVTIEQPRLVINYDNDTETPRNWTNLGFFLDKDEQQSPDGSDTDLFRIMIETGEVANDLNDHIKRIKAEYKKQTGIKVVYITPVYRYEHGGVLYRRGTAGGFDYSNCAFYIVTEESLKEYTGNNTLTTSEIEKIIDGELETYNKWLNGEVYSFILFNHDEKMIDSLGGFYDIEEIRAELPVEFKEVKLDEYIK